MLTITINEPRFVPVESTQKKSIYFRILVCVFGLAIFTLLASSFAAEKTSSSQRRLAKFKFLSSGVPKEWTDAGENYLCGSEEDSTYVLECRKARSDMAKVGAVATLAGTGAGVATAIPGLLIGLGAYLGGYVASWGVLGACADGSGLGWKASETYKFTFKIGVVKGKNRLLVKLVRLRDQDVQYAYIPVVGKPQEQKQKLWKMNRIVNINRAKLFMKSLNKNIFIKKMCDRWVYYNLNTVDKDGQEYRTVNGEEVKNNMFKDLMENIFEKMQSGLLNIKLQDPKVERKRWNIFQRKWKDVISKDSNKKDYIKAFGFLDEVTRKTHAGVHTTMDLKMSNKLCFPPESKSTKSKEINDFDSE